MDKRNIINQNSIYSGGFVLLYAVLLVSIVLTISLSLFDISYRQIILSSTTDAQQIAFYVTDGTADCIRFWDNYWDYQSPKLTPNTNNFFGYLDVSTSTNTVHPRAIPPGVSLKCGDTTPSPFTYSNGVSNLTFDYPDGTEAKVIVTKAVGTPDVNEFTVTGSNFQSSNPSLRRVEVSFTRR